MAGRRMIAPDAQTERRRMCVQLSFCVNLAFSVELLLTGCDIRSQQKLIAQCFSLSDHGSDDVRKANRYL